MSIGYTMSWIALLLSISFLLAVSAFAQPTMLNISRNPAIATLTVEDELAKIQKDHLSADRIRDQIQVNK